MRNEHRNPTAEERDERFAVDLDPEVFLSGLLAVDPVEIIERESGHEGGSDDNEVEQLADREPVRAFLEDTGLLDTATALISGQLDRGEIISADEALRILDQFCAS